MDRTLIAYLLVASVVLAAAAIIAFRTYYAPMRTYRRRQKRQTAEYEAEMAKRRVDDLES